MHFFGQSSRTQRCADVWPGERDAEKGAQAWNQVTSEATIHISEGDREA